MNSTIDRKSIEYVIFDFDGTLADSGVNIYRQICDFFEQNYQEYLGAAKYYFQKSHGYPLIETIGNIFYKNNHCKESITKELYDYLGQNTEQHQLFDGVTSITTELIGEGKRLFISTGNSSSFVEKVLGETKNQFDLILGSEQIPKSVLHIEELKQFTSDPDFCKKAIFIGDGERDGEIAEAGSISFIKIGDGDYEYKINHISELNNILK